MNEKTLVILTGGRIDSVWDPDVDEIVVTNISVIPDYLNNLKIRDLDFKQICMKDSRALTREDREEIRKAIDQSETQKIIITHGTHTLPDTIQYLNENLSNKSKTIIFTGSSSPLKDFAKSDAGFNLGYAIAKVQDLPSGMYLCLCGKTISVEEMQKLMKEGKFYSLSSS